MPRYNNRNITLLEQTTKKFVSACDKIIEERKAKNKTEIADKLGIKYSIISKMYSGERNVSIDYVLKICAVYKVNPGFLMYPFQKNIFIADNKMSAINKKMLEIEQAKRDLRIMKEFE